MNAKEYLDKYLHEGRVMQLATSSDNQPWVGSVHYVTDEYRNLYWLSLPARRHSREIAGNSRVAATVAVKVDQPVIGIQMEGSVEVVHTLATVKKIMETYVVSHGSGHDYYERYVEGVAQHVLYKFIPSRIVLFDEVHFAGNPPVMT